MPGTLLICYDVETASQSTDGFLAGAQEMHRELAIPATLFFTGRTIEERTKACRAAAEEPLFTIGQHTYSHVLLKTVYMQPDDGRPCPHSPEGGPALLCEGADLATIEQEVTRTQELYEKTFGRACRGLTGPWGYYRGLADRPDILRILARSGIRWVRTYARDERDCQPVPLTVQPFFYADQGFEDLLEIPVQGYQDDFYWERFDDRRRGPDYIDYLRWALQYVMDHDLVFCVNSHDHNTPTVAAFNETKGAWLRPLLESVREMDIRCLGCEQLYQERVGGRDGGA